MNIINVELASDVALDTAGQIDELPASISVAQRDMQQARIEEFICRADKHLYLAK